VSRPAARDRDRLIGSGLDSYLVHHSAPAADDEAIALVHGRDYIADDRGREPGQRPALPRPDTAMNAHSLTAARHAAGAAVLATDLVLSGECRTAFCAVRPPGHHAERDRAMGFCLFNNVAIGAARAMTVHGIERVAIVDFDVHHGNGTEQIFRATREC
jgi:acetoin utilization deacetylase AcuC-like enzyme